MSRVNLPLLENDVLSTIQADGSEVAYGSSDVVLPSWNQFRRSSNKVPTVNSYTNDPQITLDNNVFTADAGYSYGYPVDNDHIYVQYTLQPSGDFELGAFDRETGDQVWSSTETPTVLAMALIGDSLLVLSNFSGPFGWIIDRTDGSLISEVSLGADFATPTAITVYDGFFYAGRTDSSFSFCRLAKIDPSDGSIPNTFDLNNEPEFAQSLPIANDTMYVRDGPQTIRALDIEFLTENYVNNHGTDLFGFRNCHFDGVIYTGFGSSTNIATALSDADGSIIWQKSNTAADLPWEVVQTMEPLVTDQGLIYLARTTESSPDGRLFCLDPANGDVVFTLGPGDGFDYEAGNNAEFWPVYSESDDMIITAVDDTGERFYGIDLVNQNVLWSRTITNASISQVPAGVIAPEASQGGQAELYFPTSINGEFHIRKYA